MGESVGGWVVGSGWAGCWWWLVQTNEPQVTHQNDPPPRPPTRQSDPSRMGHSCVHREIIDVIILPLRYYGYHITCSSLNLLLTKALGSGGSCGAARLTGAGKHSLFPQGSLWSVAPTDFNCNCLLVIRGETFPIRRAFYRMVNTKLNMAQTILSQNGY